MGYGKFKFVVWTTNYADCFERLQKMEVKYEWSYLVMGEEVCPTTGTMHVDGYYEMPTPRKDKTEKNKFVRMFGEGWGRIKRADGSAGENWDYSTKEGRNTYENGKPARQGVRCDLVEAQENINDGMSVDTLAEENPMLFHMYGRTLTKLEDLRMRKLFRNFMTQGVWIWGPTGTNKSRMAFEGFTPETHYNLVNDRGWWDGYCQQETVIINDFRGWIPYDELLQLVDRYPYSVRRRGREPMPFLSKKVIITSALPPSKVYCNRNEGDSIEQLLRRFDVISTA